MHRKAWSSIEELPFCHSRSSVNFQGQRGRELPILTRIEIFPDCNSSLNSPIALKWCTKCIWYRSGALLIFKVIHQIPRFHGTKKSSIGRFRVVNPVWILQNDAQSLKYDRKCALLFIKSICYISRSHSWNKSSIVTQIGRFRTVTPVPFHWWLSNDTQNLMQYGRGALFIFNVIRYILRHTGQKNANYNTNWL